MNSASEAFAAAVGHHQAGQYSEAERLYQEVLRADADHAGAINNLGLLLMEQGQLDAAEQHFREAIAQQPKIADFYNNFGTLLVSRGRLSDALAAFDRALVLRPDYAEAYNGRGNVFKEQRLLDQAVVCYQQALQFNPALTNAYCNLANVFQEQGRLEPARAAYEQALHWEPAHAVARFGLGNVLVEQGQSIAAVECFRRAIQLKPDYAAAYINLAAALRGREDWREIVACCRRAVALRPDLIEAHLNLANALCFLGELDEAAAACSRALELNPSSAEGHNTHGNILKGLARLAEAITAYHRSVELKPDFVAAHSSLLYAIYFCPGLDSAGIYDEHVQWDRQHAAHLGRLVRHHENEPDGKRRLRIGYFSPQFREHCQSFFTIPLLANHNREQFEIYCYANVARPDALTERIRASCDQWRDISGVSEDQAAEMIRGDRIDILIDLVLHMDRGAPLLFARKPAPVQVCWLAYPGTTGLTAMDYRLTDPHLDPPGMFDRFYSEESIRLPHSFWCYDPLTEDLGGGEEYSVDHGTPRRAFRGTPRRAFPTAWDGVNGLPAVEKGYVTFGCLNNFCKVNEGMLRLWVGVMRAVEKSQLMLLAPEGSARERVLAVLDSEGVAAERVTFVPFQPRADYLATYRQIDIGLETLPYNGHTTSLDSFWMGVPVPTIVGQTVVGRAGVCLLENLGLRELIAESPEEYVRVVSELAGDLERLAELRAGLRERMEQSPLMDGKLFARDMEAAYRVMWRRWCEGQAAQSRGIVG